MTSESFRVALLMGQSQYGTLRRLTAILKDQFTDTGHRPELFDLLEPSEIERLVEGLTNRQYDLVVAFQGWLLDLIPNGPTLFEQAKVPFVALLGDQPQYHARRLRHATSWCAILTSDAFQRGDCRAIVRPDVVVGVTAFKDAIRPREPRPIRDRAIPLLLLGSAGDPQEQRDALGGNNPLLRRLLAEVLEEKLARRPIPTRQALRTAFWTRGIDIETIPAAKLNTMLESIDRVARNERRLGIVQAITRTRVSIWGAGWPAVIGQRPNIDLRTERFDTGFSAAEQSKILLNIFPDEFSAYHDRCTLAIAARCLLLSESTPLFDERIANRGLAVSFKSPNDIDDLVDHYLSNQAEFDAIVSAAERIESMLDPSSGVEQILHARRAILTNRALSSLL
jgi:hypothetical protein